MAGLVGTSFLGSPSTSKLLGAAGRNAAPGVGRTSAPPAAVVAKIREIFMPALSSTMTEGKIVSWVKNEGEKLSKGESVVVVESDKADMDVETFYDGYLAAIMVEEGGVAAVGSAIALLAETEEEISEAKSKAAAGAGSASPGPAEVPQSPPPESSQPAVPSPAPPPPAPIKSSPPIPVAVSSAHPASDGGARIVASPYAKKLAKELKVELASIAGSGPMGRIVAKDVEAAAAVAGAVASVAVSPQPGGDSPPAKAPSSPPVELGTVVPFSAMQGAVSRNMVNSLSVPTFRVGYTITTDALDALYKKVIYSASFSTSNPVEDFHLPLNFFLCSYFTASYNRIQIKSKGVTMTALLAKATAMALAKHPVVNSSCRDGKSFTYNSSINVAVAVAIDGGLITPVLQEADKVCSSALLAVTRSIFPLPSPWSSADDCILRWIFIPCRGSGKNWLIRLEQSSSSLMSTTQVTHQLLQPGASLSISAWF